VCVIGAGSSGIASCQVLDARGIPFDCFEQGSEVGGNWRYRNDNGMSSAYRSLHINTSRDLMSYATYPMPADYPDYPSHWQIAKYFDDYVDHFGLREKIRFRTEVTRVEPADGGWEVTVRGEDGSEEARRYGAVMVANGHHWDPRWPEPPFPGADEFTGEQMHAHHYQEPDVLAGKRVCVLGIGNSATDIAVESSRHADATFLAMRRGAYVIPKYLRGVPTDEAGPPILSRLPLPVQRFFFMSSIKVAAGDMEKYGLPKPDHKLLEAHPTVSSDLLPRLGHGDIAVKPNIGSYPGGRTVRFVDGSEEEIDLVVYCTGYKISFPFFDPAVLSVRDNRIPLYRRVVSAERPGLYFIGFIQPLGAIMPIAEAQSEWVADLLQGKAELPSRVAMRRVIEREDRRMAKRYVTSKRHTIQVDFYPYLRTIERERRHGARRNGPLSRLLARRSHELRLGTS
jgi:dimethylaniline monooxygenase (N-oxide forming)